MQDAIAYEFFMDNINEMIKACNEEEEELPIAVASLAQASYIIANHFCEARKQHSKTSDEHNANA